MYNWKQCLEALVGKNSLGHGNRRRNRSWNDLCSSEYQFLVRTIQKNIISSEPESAVQNWEKIPLERCIDARIDTKDTSLLETAIQIAIQGEKIFSIDL